VHEEIYGVQEAIVSHYCFWNCSIHYFFNVFS